MVVLIIEISIFVLGIASAIYLFIRKLNTVKEKKAVASAVGIYGVPSERFGIDDSRIAERKIPAGKVIKHFFSPTVIVFLAISVLTMIILILDSFMYNAGAL